MRRPAWLQGYQQPFERVIAAFWVELRDLGGHTNIRKRLLVQACGSNLGFVMRKVTGVGTPRSLQGRVGALVGALIAARRGLWRLVAGLGGSIAAGARPRWC